VRRIEMTIDDYWDRFLDGYYVARREHAYRLRAEGLSYREIGERLGICWGRVRQILVKMERHLGKGTGYDLHRVA
jgi:DNA-directed RNA polymerase specialized sigma24 family protein